jgi:hypothetical protein
MEMNSCGNFLPGRPPASGFAGCLFGTHRHQKGMSCREVPPQRSGKPKGECVVREPAEKVAPPGGFLFAQCMAIISDDGDPTLNVQEITASINWRNISPDIKVVRLDISLPARCPACTRAVWRGRI